MLSLRQQCDPQCPPGGAAGTHLTASAAGGRPKGSIPGRGRSPGGRNGSPPQCPGPENPTDRGAWWALVHRVANNQTGLKGLCKHTCNVTLAGREYHDPSHSSKVHYPGMQLSQPLPSHHFRGSVSPSEKWAGKSAFEVGGDYKRERDGAAQRESGASTSTFSLKLATFQLWNCEGFLGRKQVGKPHTWGVPVSWDTPACNERPHHNGCCEGNPRPLMPGINITSICSFKHTQTVQSVAREQQKGALNS